MKTKNVITIFILSWIILYIFTNPVFAMENNQEIVRTIVGSAYLDPPKVYTKHRLAPIRTYDRLEILSINPNFLTLLKFTANQVDILDDTISYLESPEFYYNHKNFVMSYNNMLHPPSVERDYSPTKLKLLTILETTKDYNIIIKMHLKHVKHPAYINSFPGILVKTINSYK